MAKIPLTEALDFDIIWKVSMWGSPRDYELIKKLGNLNTLDKVSKTRGWTSGEGYIVGNGKHFTKALFGKPEVTAETLNPYIVNRDSLKRCEKDHFYRWASKKQKIYLGPHLLVGQSPKRKQGFSSAVMLDDAVFPNGIVGIHSDPKYLDDLIAVCQAINSDIFLYFAMLTSRRWLVERDKLQKAEIMSMPVPLEILNRKTGIAFLEKLAKDQEFRRSENEKLMKLYGIGETERRLIRDTVGFTLDYFLNKANSAALNPPSEPFVGQYLKTLCGVLNDQFDYSERVFGGKYLETKGPLRVVSLQLGSHGKGTIEKVKSEDETDRILKKLDRQLIEEKAGSVYIQRNLRRFSGNSVSIIKPNQMRYWTESSAVLDADGIYAEIMKSWSSIR